jgi:hypothetical protein
MGRETLSEYLTTVVRELQGDERELRDWFDEVRRVATSLEGFADVSAVRFFTVWKDLPDEWRSIVNDFYTREALRNIPSTVERFVRLTPVLVDILPSKEVSIYLREASQCFVHGFFQASIALARSAVESGLNQHIKRRLGAIPATPLADKIDAAARFKLISPAGAKLAHDVRKTARDVLHRKPVKDSFAFETIVQARGFLKELLADQFRSG